MGSNRIMFGESCTEAYQAFLNRIGDGVISPMQGHETYIYHQSWHSVFTLLTFPAACIAWNEREYDFFALYRAGTQEGHAICSHWAYPGKHGDLVANNAHFVIFGFEAPLRHFHAQLDRTDAVPDPGHFIRLLSRIKPNKYKWSYEDNDYCRNPGRYGATRDRWGDLSRK